MYVRPATADDRAALPTLHTAAVREFGPKSYDAEAVRQWAKACGRSPEDYETPPDEHFTVALREDAVAGFGHVVPAVGEVHAVYVHPDHTRCGVGSTLLAELEGFARGLGLPSLSLQSSLNAVGFYEMAGYERVDESESPGGLRVMEMEKVL